MKTSIPTNVFETWNSIQASQDIVFTDSKVIPAEDI